MLDNLNLYEMQVGCEKLFKPVDCERIEKYAIAINAPEYHNDFWKWVKSDSCADSSTFKDGGCKMFQRS
jgi:hypothetical protein